MGRKKVEMGKLGILAVSVTTSSTTATINEALDLSTRLLLTIYWKRECFVFRRLFPNASLQDIHKGE